MLEDATVMRYDDIIPQIQAIIRQYGSMRLTVRQIYYRLVAGQVIENSQQSYKSVVALLTKARREGDIDYQDIEDRTREVKEGESDERSAQSYFQGFYDYVKDLDSNYSMPLWWGQPKIPIVFVEKEALASVFEEVTEGLGVDLVVCRGHPSLTLMYELSERISDLGLDVVEEVVGIYFGDYDPSGVDIERFIGESLGSDFDVAMDLDRAAITREQIARYNIPPAPAKASDSRTKGFVAREGVAWQVELDAIEPRTLQGIIRTAILEHFDRDIKRERDEELERRRAKIRQWIVESVDMDFQAVDGEA